MKNKMNWSFILGIVYGIAFMFIGLLNNELTKGGFASSTCIIIMLFWIVGAFNFMKLRKNGIKGLNKTTEDEK